MFVALITAAAAVLVLGGALGAVIYGVAGHLEADDMDGAPAYDWARVRTWAEPPPNRAPAASPGSGRTTSASEAAQVARQTLVRTPAA